MRYRLRTLIILIAVVAIVFAAYRIGYERGKNEWPDPFQDKHGDPFDMSGK
jgi:hypothetical protein